MEQSLESDHLRPAAREYLWAKGFQRFRATPTAHGTIATGLSRNEDEKMREMKEKNDKNQPLGELFWVVVAV